MVEAHKLFTKLPSFTGKGESWHTWKRKLYAVLDSAGLLKGLTENRPADAPEGADENVIATAKKAQDDWDKRNREIYNVLSYYTDGLAASAVMQFELSRNGKEAWVKLLNKFEHVGTIGKATLQSEMIQCRMKDGEDPDEYFQRVENMQARLVELGEAAMPDSLMLGIVLKNLPVEYKSLIDILDTHDGLTYAIFKERISTYHRRHLGHSKSNADNGESKDEGASSKALYTSDKRKKGSCYKCGKAGHFIKDCPKRKGGSETSKESKFGKNDEKSQEATHEKSVALVTGGVVVLAADMVISGGANTWVIDSGCTRHMSSRVEFISDITYAEGEVTVAGGRKLKSIGYGNMHVKAKSLSNEVVKLVIEDVLIVPELGPNLLSVERIMQKGGQVCFQQGWNRIKIKGHEFLVRVNQGLYTWSHFPIRRSSSDESDKAFMTASARSNLWHKRLGHRNNVDSIKEFKSKHVGIPLDFQEIKSCEVCETAKHTMISFPKGIERNAVHPVEQVHLDLVGSLEATSSVGGAKHAAVFTEDIATHEDIVEKQPVESNVDTEAGNAEDEEAKVLSGTHHKEFNRCNRQDCNIQGIHRAHSISEFALAVVDKISVSNDPATYNQATRSVEADKWLKEYGLKARSADGRSRSDRDQRFSNTNNAVWHRGRFKPRMRHDRSKRYLLSVILKDTKRWHGKPHVMSSKEYAQKLGLGIHR